MVRYSTLRTEKGEEIFPRTNIRQCDGLQGALDAKQPVGDYITAGDLKTINGESILGAGDIVIESGEEVELATVTGQELVINDAKPIEPVEMTAYGWTEAYGKSKNLFDPVKASDINNYTKVTIGGVLIGALTFQLKPNTTYTMSREKRADYAGSFQNINLGTSSKRASLLNSASGSITTLEDGLLYFGGTGDNALQYLDQYYNFQLEEGSVATAYEPFSEKEGIVNAGTYNEVIQKHELNVVFSNGGSQKNIVTLQLDTPLSKWDYLSKRDGVWGISYNNAIIESYNGEAIGDEFVSSTGELSTGACIQYKTSTENFVVLDSATQDALNGLVLYSPTSQVSSDSDLTFTLTYEIGYGSATVELNYINVKDFGAVGDGVTDDSDAIRSARDSARLNKKTLYFPAGTYMLSKCIQIYSDMHIVGAKCAVLKKYPAVTQNLTANADIGATSVQVSNASAFKVGYDIYIGAAGVNGGYADTVGYITEIDVATNTIHFNVYPRHSLDPKAGLNRAVTTAGIISSSFSMMTTYSSEDAGGNIRIEGLKFDGNKQSGEAQMYSLSPINIDPNKMNVTVRDCHVINSNADGISLQNNGQTTVDNCIVEDPTYHGIHPGYSINGVSISNCYIYRCPNSGIYDCYNVNGFSVSNCYIVDCSIGVGGLDEYSNGSNIVATTFENCYTGIRLGATFGGASVVGCSFQNCTEAITGYVGGTGTVKGCAFIGCNVAGKWARAREIVFSGNVIKECTLPIECWTQPSNPTLRSTNLVITDNIVISSESGKTSKFNINNLDVAIIKNNILTGNDAVIQVDTGTTSGLIISDNVGTVSNVNSTA